jgi:hypothetical protein
MLEAIIGGLVGGLTALAVAGGAAAIAVRAAKSRMRRR